MDRGKLLAQLSHVAWREAEAVVNSRQEWRERDRLLALSRRLAYKARELGCVDQCADELFGEDER